MIKDSFEQQKFVTILRNVGAKLSARNQLLLNDNSATDGRGSNKGEGVIDGSKGISPQTYPLIASRAMASKLGAFGLFTDENDRVPVSKIRRRVLLSRQILIQDQARGCTSISGDPESLFTKPVTRNARSKIHL